MMLTSLLQQWRLHSSPLACVPRAQPGQVLQHRGTQPRGLLRSGLAGRSVVSESRPCIGAPEVRRAHRITPMDKPTVTLSRRYTKHPVMWLNGHWDA